MDIGKSRQGRVDAASPRHFRHSRRAGLMRVLLINLCVLLVPVGVYYVLVVMHYEQYRHERSFRALTEIASNLDASLETAVGLFRNAPKPAGPGDAPEAQSKARRDEEAALKFLRRLADALPSVLAEPLDENRIRQTACIWLSCDVSLDAESKALKEAFDKRARTGTCANPMASDGADTADSWCPEIRQLALIQLMRNFSVYWSSAQNIGRNICGRDCTVDEAITAIEKAQNTGTGSTDASNEIEKFRVTISDLHWSVDPAPETRDTRGCTASHDKVLPLLDITASPPLVRFVDCARNDASIVEIDASVATMLGPSAAGQEFERVIVASARGEVVADYPTDDRNASSGALRTKGDAAPIGVFDLLSLLDTQKPQDKRLLERLATVGRPNAQSSSMPAPVKPYVILDSPQQASVRIGANVYAAYVLPYRPSTAIYRVCPEGGCLYGTSSVAKKDLSCAPSASTTCVEQEPALYVIGLSRPTAREAARDSMQPFGLMLLLTVLGTAAALWPLIRLRFLEPHDSLGWSFVKAATIGVVIAVLVLSTAGQALVLRQRLDDAVRGSAASLAKEVATSFTGELERQVRFIDRYYAVDTTAAFRCPDDPAAPANDRVSVYQFPLLLPPWTRDLNLLMRIDANGRIAAVPAIAPDPAASPPWTRDRDPVTRIDTTGRLGIFPGIAVDPTASSYWTQDLNLVTRYDANGRLAGFPTIAPTRIRSITAPTTLINAKCRAARLSPTQLANRVYFTGARATPSCIARFENSSACDLKFAVARLAAYRDGVKLTSIAVRREKKDGTFDGITLGDTRLIAYANAVLPYHFQFAIFDNATGTTIFHSNETRALTENFLSETERPPALLAALESGTQQNFAGTYRGIATHFFTHPLKKVPWTLAVFYADSPVDSIPLSLYLTTIIAVLPVLLLGIAAGSLAVRACGGSMLWLWPQWRLRNAYAVPALAVVLLGAVAAFAIASAPGASMALVIALLPVTCITLLAALLEPASVRLDFAQALGTHQRKSLTYSGRRVLVAAYLCTLAGIAAVAAWHCASASARTLAALALGLHLAVSYHAFGRRPKPGSKPGPDETALPRQNGWEDETALDPGAIHVDPSLERWSRRHAGFAVSLLLVVATMPVCIVFHIASREQLRAATLSAIDRTGDRLDLRIKRIEDDDASGRAKQEPALAAALDYGMHVPHAGDKNGPSLQPGACAADAGTGTSADQKTPPATSWAEITRKLIGVTPTNAWMRTSDDDRRRTDAGDFIERTRDVNADRYCVRYPVVTGAYLRAQANGKHTADTVAVLVWLGLLALLAALLRYLTHNLFGQPLSWSGQFGPQPPHHVRSALPHEPARFVLAIRSGEPSFGEESTAAAATAIDLASQPFCGIERTLREASGSFLLKRLDIAMLDPARRVRLLPVLEELFARTTANDRIFLTVDVPPLYRLCRPGAYRDDEPPLEPSEQLRWITLFARMEKSYGAFGADAGAAAGPPPPSALHWCTVDEMIAEEECPMWPALETISQQLRSQFAHNPGLRCTERDVVEYFALRGEVHFRAAWEVCTRDERLALYQLARDRLVNVENMRTLEHLKRRGLIVIAPYARITSRSFKEFVLHAELPGTFEQWEAEASEGLWQSIRVPLLIVLLLILAWVAYSSGETLNVVIALIGSALTFLGTLFRAISFVRSGQAIDAALPGKR